MRFAHVRVAAVTLLSGSFLTLGLLADAQAAPIATKANTHTVCQAPPSSSTPTPPPPLARPRPSPPRPVIRRPRRLRPAPPAGPAQRPRRLRRGPPGPLLRG